MSAPAWTPGPWEVRSDGTHTYQIAARIYVVGKLVVFDHPGLNGPANARLIAACPEVTTAAVSALNFIDTMVSEWGVGGEEADALRAALTKAGAL